MQPSSSRAGMTTESNWRSSFGGGVMRGEAPSSKLQAPEKLQASSSKCALALRLQWIGIWCLKFLWSLALGPWSFVSISAFGFRILLSCDLEPVGVCLRVAGDLF